MNRKQRRAAARGRSHPLSRAQFDVEIRKVIEGRPDADPTVAAFWDDTRDALGVEVATMRPNGDVEFLHREDLT